MPDSEISSVLRGHGAVTVRGQRGANREGSVLLALKLEKDRQSRNKGQSGEGGEGGGSVGALEMLLDLLEIYPKPRRVFSPDVSEKKGGWWRPQLRPRKQDALTSE